MLCFLLVSPLYANDNEPPFTLTMNVTVPTIKTNPYHRPYVAVWLETPNRKGVHTFAFWREQEDWFKDLRQWWRKIGRKNNPNYDAISAATRKPGEYTLTWQGQLSNGEQISPGDYVLHFESVREQGSREYFRQKITLDFKQRSHINYRGKLSLALLTFQLSRKL